MIGCSVRAGATRILVGAFAFALLGLTQLGSVRTASAAQASSDLSSLHSALDQLATEGRFSGAVVIHGAEGVRFARGYGLADPFSQRRFTPETPVDSASLAKPVTAAAILWLAKEGKLDLDERVRRYLRDYPHEATTVRHLLAHSAGLPLEESLEPLADKTNEMIMKEIAERHLPPMFMPGSGFNYCNFCYTTLALLIEEVSGTSYLGFVQRHLAVPRGVTIRPVHLAEWTDRAIGYRRTAEGKLERADSYESEAFYGSANLSISASQLAQWGTQWWKAQLAPIRPRAIMPARIDGKPSGLSWGSWYCSSTGEQCHYLGHHEGFHHMLYWDVRRRISVAMVSNNTLASSRQQRLQRALVAFAQNDLAKGVEELRSELPDHPVRPGRYTLPSAEVVVVASDDNRMSVVRSGVRYPAYPMSVGIRYVPGLDTYLAARRDGRLNWLSLYEDVVGDRK